MKNAAASSSTTTPHGSVDRAAARAQDESAAGGGLRRQSQGFGVHADPHEIMDRALASTCRRATRCRSLARKLAAEREWKATRLRDVIRALKKERIPEDQLMKLYNGRLAQHRRHHPSRKHRDAARAQGRDPPGDAKPNRPRQPAPHIDPPRLIGNTGEAAEFVLPTRESEREGRRRDGRLQLRRDRLDADGARSASRVTSCSLRHARARRVDRSRGVRIQQRQHRRVGAVCRSGDEAIPSGRRADRRPCRCA